MRFKFLFVLLFISVTSWLKANAENLGYTLENNEGDDRYEWVDLGLPSGLKWATCNIGATSPEEDGDYFAWGDTKPYYTSLNPLKWKEGKEKGYCCNNYKYGEGSNNFKSLIKYNTKADLGVVDDRKVLSNTDDAAFVNWGDNWRMPNQKECEELANMCKWSEIEVKGKKVIQATGPNGKTLIFPISQVFLDKSRYDRDYFEIWTRDLDSDPSFAKSFKGDANSAYTSFGNREYGLVIRPVFSK